MNFNYRNWLLVSTKMIPKLATLLCLLVALSACNSGGNGNNQDSVVDESLSLLFLDGELLSFVEENNALGQRDLYDDELFVSLNTFDNTPHFDFAIYAQQNTLLSVNYLSGRIIPLVDFDAHICDLLSYHEYVEDDEQSVLVNALAVTVVTAENSDCSGQQQYTRLNMTLQETSNAFLDGDEIIDIESLLRVSLDEFQARYTVPLANRGNSDRQRRYGSLHYDQASEQIVVANDAGRILWRYQASNVGSNVTLKALEGQRVLIRLGTEVFILTHKNLLQAGDFDANMVPVQSDVDALFALPQYTLSGNALSPDAIISKGKALLLLDDSRLLYDQDLSDNQHDLTELSVGAGALSFSYDLQTSARIIVHESYAGGDQLTYITPTNERHLLAEAHTIAYAIQGESLFANLYESAPPVADQTGTQAYVNQQSTAQVYSSAQWLIFEDWTGQAGAPMLAEFNNAFERYIFSSSQDESRYIINRDIPIGPVLNDEAFTFEGHTQISPKLAIINYLDRETASVDNYRTHLLELDDLIIGRTIQ